MLTQWYQKTYYHNETNLYITCILNLMILKPRVPFQCLFLHSTPLQHIRICCCAKKCLFLFKRSNSCSWWNSSTDDTSSTTKQVNTKDSTKAQDQSVQQRNTTKEYAALFANQSLLALIHVLMMTSARDFKPIIRCYVLWFPVYLANLNKIYITR